MKKYKDTYHAKKVFLKGSVSYEDKEPVKGAIVILEQLRESSHLYTSNPNHEAICAMYTITNRYGEFCFFIEDISKGYKIKVFNNHYSDEHYLSSEIDIDLD